MSSSDVLLQSLGIIPALQATVEPKVVVTTQHECATSSAVWVLLTLLLILLGVQLRHYYIYWRLYSAYISDCFEMVFTTRTDLTFELKYTLFYGSPTEYSSASIVWGAPEQNLRQLESLESLNNGSLPPVSDELASVRIE